MNKQNVHDSELVTTVVAMRSLSWRYQREAGIYYTSLHRASRASGFERKDVKQLPHTKTKLPTRVFCRYRLLSLTRILTRRTCVQEANDMYTHTMVYITIRRKTPCVGSK